MITSSGKYTGIPIYESLAERLRGSIREGRFAPGDLIGSEHELARQESISRMTVRKASELLIGEGLLERRPGKGLFVRDLAGLRGGVVQVIVGNLLWETSVQMARGVQEATRGDGTHVQLYDAQRDIGLDLQLIDQLPESSARGAVIVSLHHPAFSQAICRLQDKGFPFVLLDQRMRDIDVFSVTSDNHGGGVMVGEKLAQTGHKRIAFIGDLAAATVQDRLTGMRDGLADAGIAVPRSRIIDLNVGEDRFADWGQRIDAGVNRLMSQPNVPTAIFCSCDAIARQVYRALEALNLSVPQDVSIVGYDDDPLAEYLNPKLTTVRQPFRKMGESAMELLRKRIARPDAQAELCVLPVEWVERASVSSPREDV